MSRLVQLATEHPWWFSLGWLFVGFFVFLMVRSVEGKKLFTHHTKKGELTRWPDLISTATVIIMWPWCLFFWTPQFIGKKRKERKERRLEKAAAKAATQSF